MSTVFPQIVTKKISLRGSYSASVKIDFAIRSSANMSRALSLLQTRNYRWWNDSDNIRRKVKIYFMILTDEQYREIANQLYGAGRTRLPALLRDIKRGTYRLAKGAYREVFLEDILKEQAYTSRTTTSSDVSSPGYTPSSPNNDPGELRTDSEVFASVEMEYRPYIERPLGHQHHPQDWDPMGQRPPSEIVGNYADLSTDKLHLVSFTGIEILPEDNFTLANGAPGSATDQSNMGEASYDLLLRRGHAGDLEIPEFREVLFFDDPIVNPNLRGTSFRPGTNFSPAEYVHLLVRPDPRSPERHRQLAPYTGWASRMQDPPASAIALSSRRVKNHKVFSDTLRRSAPALSAPMGPNLSIGATGQELELFVNSTMHLNEIRDQRLKLERLVRTSILANGRNITNVVDWGSADTSHINLIFDPHDHRGAPLQESHYGCVIGVNFLDLVKYNSVFGGLLDFHHEKKNESGERTNLDIVNEVLFHSHLVNFRVNRQRVKPEPDNYNDQDTKIYSKFEKNQIDKCLIFSSDEYDQCESGHRVLQPSENLRHRLTPVRSADASLEEVEIVTIGDDGSLKPEPFSRQFVVRDYDLFHNISYGKYTYVVDIILKDGFKEMIQKTLTSFDAALNYYESALVIASIPTVRDPRTQQVISGNYDYESNQLAPTFSSTVDFDSAASGIVDSYSMVARLLGADWSNNRKDRLLTSLSLSNFKVDIASEFKELATEARNSLAALLTTAAPRPSTCSPPAHIGSLSQPTLNGFNQSKLLGTGVMTDPSSSPSTLDDSISIKSKTNIVVDAFSSTQLLSDFSWNAIPTGGNIIPFGLFQNSIPSARILQTDLDDTRIMEILPNRFVRVTPDSYEDQQHGLQVYSTNNYKDLTSALQLIDMNRNRVYKAPSGVDELVNFEEYGNVSSRRRGNLKTEINLMRTPDIGLTGTNFKPPSYFLNQMQSSHFGGVSIDIIHHGLERDTLTEGSLGNLPLWVYAALPDLSDDVKKTICEAAGRSVDKRDFIDQLVNTIETLADLRDTLGAFYDTFNDMLSVVDVSLSSRDRGVYDLPRPRPYSAIPVSPGPPSMLDASNPFTRETACAYVISPGAEKKKLNLSQLYSTGKLSTRFAKKVMFIKLEQIKQKDSIVPVNNAFMIEV